MPMEGVFRSQSLSAMGSMDHIQALGAVLKALLPSKLSLWPLVFFYKNTLHMVPVFLVVSSQEGEMLS